jgi:hypothetical protein
MQDIIRFYTAIRTGNGRRCVPKEVLEAARVEILEWINETLCNGGEVHLNGIEISALGFVSAGDGREHSMGHPVYWVLPETGVFFERHKGGQITCVAANRESFENYLKSEVVP